ncbi:MAG: RNA polymerase sigma factor [Deltaproteobacteria bacterium]|nr:RNA polymerase sigma factor [Deltaproteobacteria bacterium]
MELNVEAMYRRYGDMVLGRCRTLLRNEADAQDVCQEVFLRLHRYREGFRFDASPTTYLYRITTTTCLNHIRGRSRRREELEEEPPRSPSRTAASPRTRSAIWCATCSLRPTRAPATAWSTTSSTA